MREDFEGNVNLLRVEAQTAVRKALEAFSTHAKDPKLNRKEECLYIARGAGSSSPTLGWHPDSDIFALITTVLLAIGSSDFL